MSTLYELYQHPTWFLVIFGVIAVWSFIWKGVAMWHAGKNRQKGWFISLLILNTAGILPIIYLLFYKPSSVIVREEKEQAQEEIIDEPLEES